MTAIAAIGSILAGCGSAAVTDLPPAAGPAQSPPLSRAPAGELIDPGTPLPEAPAPSLGGFPVAVDRRERALELLDPRTRRRLAAIPAGVGPTNVVTDGVNLAYVVDTVGGAVLVARRRPRLEITRRVHVPGSPYAIAIDRARGRLWVTATETNELVQLSAGGRPRPLARFPTVRQPDAVAVDAAGRVLVKGRGLQRLGAP